jgi:hypothetical protein
MAGLNQSFAQVRADETRGPGNQTFHDFVSHELTFAIYDTEHTRKDGSKLLMLCLSWGTGYKFFNPLYLTTSNTFSILSSRSAKSVYPVQFITAHFAETRLIWRLNEATLGTSLHKGVPHKGCAVPK